MVKLTRVALLAPLVVAVGVARRREATTSTVRPPLLPWFVTAFLAAVAVRSTGLLGSGTVDVLDTAGAATLAMAMVGLGAGVSWRKLRSIGTRPLALGAVAWVLVAGVSAIGIVAFAP